MVRVEGPVVSNLNAVFLGDWYSESGEVLTDEVDLFSTRSGPSDLDCQIVPSGPGFEFQNNLKLFMGLLYAARERAIIVSPYFVPDEALLVAIATSAQRGVQVELFVSEEGDQAMVYHAQRSYYEALLRAGASKGQGFLFSHPMPLDAARELLASGAVCASLLACAWLWAAACWSGSLWAAACWSAAA